MAVQSDDNLLAVATSRSAEIKRQIMLLILPTTLFILVPSLVAFCGGVLLQTLCPITNAQMSLCQPEALPDGLTSSVYAAIALLAIVTVVGLRLKHRWAIILNAILLAALVLRLLIWIIAWTYAHVIASGGVGLSVDFSSVFAVLSLAVVLLFAGCVIWYPCMLYYRHIILRSIWLFGSVIEPEFDRKPAA